MIELEEIDKLAFNQLVTLLRDFLDGAPINELPSKFEKLDSTLDKLTQLLAKLKNSLINPHSESLNLLSLLNLLNQEDSKLTDNERSIIHNLLFNAQNLVQTIDSFTQIDKKDISKLGEEKVKLNSYFRNFIFYLESLLKII